MMRGEPSVKPPYLIYALCIPGGGILVVTVAAKLMEKLGVESGELLFAVSSLAAVAAYFSPPFTLAAAILCLVRPAPKGHRMLRWVALVGACAGFGLFARLFLSAT